MGARVDQTCLGRGQICASKIPSWLFVANGSIGSGVRHLRQLQVRYPETDHRTGKDISPPTVSLVPPAAIPAGRTGRLAGDQTTREGPPTQGDSPFHQEPPWITNGRARTVRGPEQQHRPTPWGHPSDGSSPSLARSCSSSAPMVTSVARVVDKSPGKTGARSIRLPRAAAGARPVQGEASSGNAVVKGAKSAHTARNGHMFSFLDAEGSMALRLPDDLGEEFRSTYDSGPVRQ